MGRPPKYNWEPIDRLIAAGVSAGEIAKKVGAPRQSIDNRIRRHTQKTPQTQTPFVVKVSGDTLDPTQTPLKTHSNPPETCPTEEALKSQIYCNQTRGLLKDLERKSRDSVKLAIALQAETARFLTGKSNIRACDLAHIANVISSLERVGSEISEEEVFETISSMMKFGWLDEERSARAVVKVRESRDAVLEDLWEIVQNPRSNSPKTRPKLVQRP